MRPRLPATPLGRMAALGVLLAAIHVGALALQWLPEAVLGQDLLTDDLRSDLFLAAVMASVGVYFLAVRLALRARLPRAGIWLVLAVAVAMRAVLVPGPPYLSTDVYRYVWDGRVQAAGINPYLHIPDDPALAALRDDAVYPNINRRDYARTIYPPAAQLVFAAVGRVSDGVTAMKLAMLGFEAIGVAGLLGLLRIAGLPPERALIYAWNPLPAWAFACDGHVDAVAIGILGVALLARARRRDALAGGLLGAATLVKFLPVVAAPAFVRGGGLWRPMLAGATVILVLFLPYLAAGREIFGFLGTYGAEEGFDSGVGYWLVAGLQHAGLVAAGGHLPLPPPWLRQAYLAAAAGLLGALALWTALGRERRGRDDAIVLCRDTAVLAAVATCAASPHYFWYYAWLALPAAVAPIPAVVWLGSAPLLLMIDPFHDRFVWPSLVFVPAILLAIRSLWRARRVALALPQGAVR